ncbi:polysaccharide pyruvyl transferase family protein [Desulfovibrio sp. OttesenSCG-928-C14]|nr:polysaccharide pyruvyl transferase family protein [Desulfovibrio sp. OttesenSCG-928-C14]
MKLCKLKFDGSAIAGATSKEYHYFNLGDALQQGLPAYIYKLIGITDDQTITLSFYDLDKYVGEYAVLPVNILLTEVAIKKWLMGAKYIIPVFLALGIAPTDKAFEPPTIDYLRRYSPIGCRDEYTLDFMRQHNIPAYLNGCMTITVPRRKAAPEAGKVFFVDAPKTLKDFVPEQLKKKAVFTTHGYSEAPPEAFYEGELNCIRWAWDRLEQYKKQAMLVVSSRLHVLAPCIAAGIPVIAARSSFDTRYGWLDKFIPLYEEPDFHTIDWSPKPLELEDFKRDLLENASRRLMSTFNENKLEKDICWFYENRGKPDEYAPPPHYAGGALSHIKSCWPEKQPREYSVWGVTRTTEVLVRYIETNYPDVKLKDVFDASPGKKFRGIAAKQPREMVNDETFLFVTSIYANKNALSIFEGIGKKPGSYYICSDSLLSAEDFS